MTNPITDADTTFAALPQPTPSAGEEAYQNERKLALSKSAAKRENFDRFMATRRGESELEYLPVKLDIENVSRCNFSCPMCVVSDWHKGQRAGDMSVDFFRKLLEEQYGLLEIKLQGIGEPLLQRDDFFEMIKIARAEHIWVRTTTNASLLHLNGNIKKLVDADPNEIQVSIDGATKETFEKIRVGGKFEQVIANAQALNAYCDEKNVRKTKMWVVAQKDNAHELADLVNLAADNGFKKLVFSLVLSDWAMEEMSERNESVSVFEDLTMNQLMGLHEQGKELGVDVAFWVVNSKYKLGDPKTLCPWVFERSYIGSDGRVTPCCYIGNPDVYEIGNGINGDQDFTSIWRSEEYVDFRRMHLEGRLPSVCKNCYE